MEKMIGEDENVTCLGCEAMLLIKVKIPGEGATSIQVK
jgi:hypothetical protein